MGKGDLWGLWQAQVEESHVGPWVLEDGSKIFLLKITYGIPGGDGALDYGT